MCAAKTNTHAHAGARAHTKNWGATRNSKRQTGGCLLRLGAHKLCAAGQRRVDARRLGVRAVKKEEKKCLLEGC